MQEYVGDDPGRCFEVIAGPGEKVLVPPGWGHATISADPNEPLTFGAWCDREYGFEYEAVRAHKGWRGIRYYRVTTSLAAQPALYCRAIAGRHASSVYGVFTDFSANLSAIYIRPGALSVYLSPG